MDKPDFFVEQPRNVFSMVRLFFCQYIWFSDLQRSITEKLMHFLPPVDLFLKKNHPFG
jgi:hypothetical protein